ncbi:MAG: PhoH family protein, partial [Gaiellaceae bacterium]
MQEVLSVSNEVAAELATVDDGILGALRRRLGLAVLLRGNQLTLEGEQEKVGEARLVIDELAELVEGGHAIGAGTVDAVLTALDESRDLRDVFEDVVWRHRGKKITPKTVNQKRYVE